MPSFPELPGRMPGLPPAVRLLIPIAIVAAFVAATGVFGCFYTVPADSVGVVQRFGRAIGVAEPGLRFKLPLGIDRVTILPVKRQLKMEFGFASSGATNPDQASAERTQESEMLTGDLNAAHVEWVVQYEIDDPIAYLFHAREPGPTLRDLSESVMREVVGDRTVDELLTVGRQGVEVEAIAKLQELAGDLDLGLRVQQVQLKDVLPPTAVRRSFDEVNRAQQEREEMINQANGDYNRVVPRASGEAEQRISSAEGYAIRRVAEAEGDADRFRRLLAEYEKAPDVTRQRLYLETLADVLPRLGGKVILDADARQVLPLFPLPGLTPGAMPSGGDPAVSPERADGPDPDRIPALRRRGSE